MAKIYPRGHTLIIFVLCAFAVGGVYYYTQYGMGRKTVSKNDASQQNVAAASAPIVGKLADNWQKQFLAESSSIDLKAKPKSTNKDTGPKTLTDAMGRNFITHYLELQTKNLTDNDQFVQNAVDQTIDEALAQAKKARVYTSQDIILARNSDTTSIKTYANEVGRVLLYNGPKVNALEIASQALEKGDLKMLSAIAPVTAAYKTMVQKFLAIPVPSSLTQTHIDLVNSFSQIGHMTESMQNLSKDPMQAVVALDAHNKAQDVATQALQNIKSVLDQMGITYTQSEPGIFFSITNLALQ